jgi:hypothetical protein
VNLVERVRAMRGTTVKAMGSDPSNGKVFMSYAIIGFGKIGQALAKAFARSGIEVSVATTHDPESFTSAAAAIGPEIISKKLAEAVKADIIFLAVRFESHRDVAKALSPTGVQYSLNRTRRGLCRSPSARFHSPPIIRAVCRGQRRWVPRALADIPPPRSHPRTSASPATRRSANAAQAPACRARMNSGT